MANTPPWDGIPIYGWELVEAVGPYCRLLWVLMDAEEGDSEVQTCTRPADLGETRVPVPVLKFKHRGIM